MPQPDRFLETVDFDRIANAGADERLVQQLVGASSGVASCAISYIRTPAGGGSPDGKHTHVVDQMFYILAGIMTVEIQADQYDAGPGTLVIFPAGVPHRNWNAGSEPTVHLAINAPAPDPAVPLAIPVD
jgi:mannose-6-phosphate isomerase-like protein (cupin superfamily)